MMKETNTLIIGASIAGLASAACLQRKGVEYIIIEKEAQVVAPWRHHYQRLHLHTPKNLSNLPYKKFSANIPRYPSRQQVIDYAEAYQKEFNIRPAFSTAVHSVKMKEGGWITETSNGTFKSKHVIVAMGAYGKPKEIRFAGMETFPGQILHSYQYKTGLDFKGQKVLVVGFGNSACEIAIDLHEQGAVPSMAVRSPVNIIPRDLLGVPILRISQLMSKFPPRLADRLNAPLLRLLFGDISKLGLQKMPYGVFEQISKEESIPLLDIGTVKHIREGHITVYRDIDHIAGNTVYFTDGRKDSFDAIVAAIGYYRDYAGIIDVDKSRFGDLKAPVSRQQYFGKDGLYFCGYRISPTGQFREIASDAKKIARDIAGNKK